MSHNMPDLNDEKAGTPPPRIDVRVLRPTLGFLTSAVVHLAILLVLAMVVMKPTVRGVLELVGNVSRGEQDPIEIFDLKMSTASLESGVQSAEPDEAIELSPGLPAFDVTTPGGFQLPDYAENSPLTASGKLDAMLTPTHLPVGGGLGGRSPEMRGQLAAGQGGTPESERAVEMGLEWLAAHQNEDGSWHFNYQDNDKCVLCGNPGSVATTTGATGLALLAFLGAGYTHQQGAYKDVVDKGLYYLTSRMLITPHGGDLQEGTMYGHGIATLALCEAYAMTNDQSLRTPAQHAINFICSAQHTEGGWRYLPGQPGDTTVFGWQMMALKSGSLTRLEIPSPIVPAAMHYLDTVQEANGSIYLYQKGFERDKGSPTAIGLLSRMYYGWRGDDPRLLKGVMFLEAMGPSKTDAYFNYYATQVMHHYQGSFWDRWNQKMREYLIATQATEGHERGSWYFPDRHGTIGGRLYTTAMCTMILEVYYRYMPLYGDSAVETGF